MNAWLRLNLINLLALHIVQLRTLAAFFLLNVTAFSLIVIVTLMLVAVPQRVKVLGSICLAFSMAVFVAPMSVIVSSLIFPSGLDNHVLPCMIHPNYWSNKLVTRRCRCFCSPARGDQDQERGVHALLPLLLPHPQRRRMVLLRPLHQGPLRRGN